MYQTLTLPVDGDSRLDADEARRTGEMFRNEFEQADPFPSIVFEEFLPPSMLLRAVDGFPRRSLASDGVFEMGYAGQFKRQILPEDCDEQTRQLFWFFNSRGVLQFLEGLTGIEGLLPDPYFTGGGYHETTRGGLLGVHADFRLNERLNLQRRLNLIVYLNAEWRDEWQGHLELWSRDMSRCARRIAPLMNRCVIFRTDADTWHGHPDPLATPDGVARRSLALYYYTASKAVRAEVPANDTVYVPRESDAPAVRKEAQALHRWERLRDWLPPKLYRRLMSRQYAQLARVRARHADARRDP